MNTATFDPSQYRTDARGALVPVNSIKPSDLMRDDLIKEIIAKVTPLNAQLAELKRDVINDLRSFIDISANEYGVALGGKKGNVTLTSFDGAYRIQIAMQDTLHFDERLQAAKQLIDECLHEWTQNSGADLKTIVQAAFDVNKEGQINTSRVLGLRRLNIQNEKWLQAMNILSDSIQVQASNEYVRFYQRNKDGKYELINLDIATL